MPIFDPIRRILMVPTFLLIVHSGYAGPPGWYARPPGIKKVAKGDEIFLSQEGRKLSWNSKDGHEAIKSMNDGTEQTSGSIYLRACVK